MVVTWGHPEHGGDSSHAPWNSEPRIGGLGNLGFRIWCWIRVPLSPVILNPCLLKSRRIAGIAVVELQRTPRPRDLVVGLLCSSVWGQRP